MQSAPVIPSRAHGRRRDRRGRGPRGVLVPPVLGKERTSRSQFERYLAGALARLERSWAKELEAIDVGIEDVPTSDPATWEFHGVPVAQAFGRSNGQKARITLFRRPIEARAIDPDDVAILVLDVLVEQLASLLGRSPEDIDPGYGG